MVYLIQPSTGFFGPFSVLCRNFGNWLIARRIERALRSDLLFSVISKNFLNFKLDWFDICARVKTSRVYVTCYYHGNTKQSTIL